MTELIVGLVRHGETDWNFASKLQGTSDIPLNELGIKQAVTASRNIAAHEWDLVLSSPLSRALDTARIIADGNALGEVQVTPLLLERAFGDAEGLNYHEWKKSHDSGAQVPGLETLEELEKRARGLLDWLEAEYAGKRVLAVSHGAFIRKLVRVVSQRTLPLDGDRFANASLTKLAHRNGSWSVEYYNPVSLGS